jgi:hypothetical protein
MRDSTQEEKDAFKAMNEGKLAFATMYAAVASKLKSKGSNYTPPKKKRKK